MSTPTMEDRRKFAKSGVAMPDGSFYIRDVGELSDAISAVGRATPNAGESETARRNSVRRHIMRRARALKRTDMIPDSWNPDGSLKHSDLEEWLEHHGIKGMHWGVRRRHPGTSGSSPSAGGSRRPSNKVRKADVGSHPAHERKAAKIQKRIDNADSQLKQMHEQKKLLEDNRKIVEGHLKKHGERGHTLANPDVRELLMLHNQLVLDHRSQVREIEKMQKHRTKLVNRHTNLKHGIDDSQGEAEDLIEAVLAHYGVLGMKWGRRRSRSASSSSTPKSAEAAKAARLQTRAQTHGSKSLTNQELQQLVTRMNLENQYGRLSPQQVSTGKKIALGLLVGTGGIALAVGKQTAASFASKYAAQGVEALIKAAAAKKG